MKPTQQGPDSDDKSLEESTDVNPQTDRSTVASDKLPELQTIDEVRRELAVTDRPYEDSDFQKVWTSVSASTLEQIPSETLKKLEEAYGREATETIDGFVNADGITEVVSQVDLEHFSLSEVITMANLVGTHPDNSLDCTWMNYLIAQSRDGTIDNTLDTVDLHQELTPEQLESLTVTDEISSLVHADKAFLQEGFQVKQSMTQYLAGSQNLDNLEPGDIILIDPTRTGLPPDEERRSSYEIAISQVYANAIRDGTNNLEDGLQNLRETYELVHDKEGAKVFQEELQKVNQQITSLSGVDLLNSPKLDPGQLEKASTIANEEFERKIQESVDKTNSLGAASSFHVATVVSVDPKRGPIVFQADGGKPHIAAGFEPLKEVFNDYDQFIVLDRAD